MKKFLRKASFGIIAVILLYVVMFVIHISIVGPQYYKEYNASIIDKISFGKSISSSKIILVGNSNVAFGFDSNKLSEVLGMPVVNLGLHGGLGNAFHENMARHIVNKGDYVVICHSDYSDDGLIGSYGLAWITVELYRELWTFVPHNEYFKMVMFYPQYFMGTIKNAIKNKLVDSDNNMETCYARKAFNKYGDVIFKPTKGRMQSDFFKKRQNKIELPKVNTLCANRINMLTDYCRQRGAIVLIAAYPIAYGEYASFNEKEIYRFQTLLQKNMKCDVISDFRDYLFPYSQFYDTTLHLTKEGAEYRTSLLIKDIMRWRKAISQ